MLNKIKLASMKLSMRPQTQAPTLIWLAEAIVIFQVYMSCIVALAIEILDYLLKDLIS
jgi:hypothetical protein